MTLREERGNNQKDEPQIYADNRVAVPGAAPRGGEMIAVRPRRDEALGIPQIIDRAR
jgi:hypothetical protein